MVWISKKKKNRPNNQDTTPLIKKVKSNDSTEEDEWVDKWYVRIAALAFAPLYAALKAYDLGRWIWKCIKQAVFGLLQLFIFLFCFGWFFNTVLFKKFKKIRCVRFLNKKKVHLHILNIGAAALQGYVLRLMIPLTPDHPYNKYLTPICGTFALLLLLICFKFPKVHCFCLLVLPMSASRHGRRFLLTLMIVSLYEGPIFNIQHNTDIIIEQMNCIADKGKNVSDVAVEQMKEPYRRLHSQVMDVKNKTKEKMDDIQNKIDKVGEKVTKKYKFLVSVVKKVNDFVDKCEGTMKSLNSKCDDVFKCGGDKKRAAMMGIGHDGNLTNFSFQDFRFPKYAEENERFDKHQDDGEESDVNTHHDVDHETASEVRETTEPRISEIPESAITPVHFLANNSNELPPTNTSDTTVYPVSTVHHHKATYHAQNPTTTLHHGKVFHIRSRRGWADDILCFFKGVAGLIIRPICNVIFNAISFLCRIPKLLVNFVTGIMMNRFKYLQRTVKNNVWMEVNTNLTYDRQVVEVRSARTAFKEIQEKIGERLTLEEPGWVRWTGYAKLLTFLLVYYHTYKYLSNYSRDASFDNHYIDYVLIKHDEEADKSIFPLTSKDTKKYVVTSQMKMLPHETFIMNRSSIKALVTIGVVLAIEGGNILLQLLVRIMYTYGPVKVEHYIDISGDSAKNGSLPNDTIYLSFDTTSCFRPPSVTPVSVTAYNLAISSLILLLAVTQVYILRTRHSICDRFVPIQKEQRVNYLHTKIRRSREFFVQHLAENLFQKVAERSKQTRMMPWWSNKPRCIVCSTKHYLQRCNGCDTMYCVNCLMELDNDCKICSDPVHQRNSRHSVYQRNSHHPLSA